MFDLDNISHNCCPWPVGAAWPWQKVLLSSDDSRVSQLYLFADIWSPMQPLNGFWRNLTGNKYSIWFMGIFHCQSVNKIVGLACDWLRNWSISPLQAVNEFRLPEQEASTHSFLVHLSRRLKCTIVITRRPSVCLSVRRPSVVNFSHFRLILCNRLTEFNETWQEARTQYPLPSLCFSGWSEKKNKMAALVSDWLIHFLLLLWNRWTEFKETWQQARSQCPLPSLSFSGRS